MTRLLFSSGAQEAMIARRRQRERNKDCCLIGAVGFPGKRVHCRGLLFTIMTSSGASGSTCFYLSLQLNMLCIYLRRTCFPLNKNNHRRNRRYQKLAILSHVYILVQRARLGSVPKKLGSTHHLLQHHPGLACGLALPPYFAYSHKNKRID